MPVPSNSSTPPQPPAGSRFARYCEQVRTWIRKGPVTRERIEEVRMLASSLVAEPLQLTARQREIPPQGYGRHLLYRDPHMGFVVIAMVWPQGICGLPHDHGTWGVVVVAEGDVEITDYRLDRLEPSSDRVRLRERSRVIGQCGATAFVLPPDDEVHRVRNVTPTGPAVSIHTYGKDITNCRTFDLRTGRVTWTDVKYDSVP